MSELRRAKARYATNRHDAYRLTEGELGPSLKVGFRLSEWNASSMCAYADQWRSQRNLDAEWDWPEIFRKYDDPDRLPIVIWVEDRLCGLGIGVTTNEAVVIKYLEREPSSDSPLKGKCVLVAVDVAARYAQARGKKELRAFPLNSLLEQLYCDTYGFEVVTPPTGSPYCRKIV